MANFIHCKVADNIIDYRPNTELQYPITGELHRLGAPPPLNFVDM